MKGSYKLVLAALAGIVIGAAGIKLLYAQSNTPPGYLIAENDVTDTGTYQKYAAQVPSTLAPFTGRYIVRAGKTDSLEGTPPTRVVVIAFDSMATARHWYDSPAYQVIEPLRRQSAKSRIFIVEGVSP